MSNRTLVGEQAKTQGGAQFDAGEVKTQLRDPISGKTIYRKAINFGALPNTTTKSVAHGIANLNLADGAYLKVEGMVTTGSAATPIGLTANLTAFSIDATNIDVTTGADLTGSALVVFLEYTKT